MTEVRLRELRDEDLPAYWQHLTDPDLQWQAGMTRDYHYEREAFDAHWVRIRANPRILHRTVLADGVVAGQVASFDGPDGREVTYWIGPEHGGRGIATEALRQLLALDTTRPLHAGAAADNAASLRILEKCGFVVTGHDRDEARARGGGEVDVVLLELA
ncbi:MAG: GNAT family N-acetyltransferase [Micrococcales bacterium]|nr:GNAT family N-acetyltransferase [Micrococcales bacterium]